MPGGFFITLYDEDALILYLKNGLYGTIINPVLDDEPSSRSSYYKILADYACGRAGSEVFFFVNRQIIYGGTLIGKDAIASFYLNGETSTFGKRKNAKLFWDESSKYVKTEKEGIFKLSDEPNSVEKAQPFIFEFKHNELTGKYICSDDLYFELGKYPFPLPSNSIQKVSFCTITPGEVKILKKLIKDSDTKKEYVKCLNISKGKTKTIFDKSLISLNDNFINEAQFEFTILSNLEPFKNFFNGNYSICRQVPISPFKPMNMDRADICLYDNNDPIRDGTIPNVIIELKRKKANYNAYNQVVRYLLWLKKICTPDEFDKISVFIISTSFCKIKSSKVNKAFDNKIKMISTNNFSIIKVE